MNHADNVKRLAPCPFCGGNAYFERTGTGRRSCIVACEGCGARHEGGDEYENSGDSWNNRAAVALGEPVAREESERWLAVATDLRGMTRFNYNIPRIREAATLLEDAYAYAQAAQDTPTQQDYREGVNVDRLSRALMLMGIASYGQEEMRARMSECINSLTLGVDRYFAALSNQQTAATGEVLTDAEKRELIGNYFAEDWAKKAASELLHDFEHAVLEKLK